MTLFTSAVASELGDLSGEPVGVGLCDAMLGTAELIRARRPGRLVFVGTAGALPGSELQVGDVIYAREVRLGDAALALGLGYSPRHPGPLGCRRALGLRDAVVVTNLAITSDTALAARYGQHAHVEHMEAYGFALACDRAGVEWCCVLGIANAVGPDAHSQWVQHRVRAETAARAAASPLAALPPSR